MGSITHMLQQLTGADEEEKAAKERLELMVTLARSKLQTAKDELKESFLNPDAVKRTEIPGRRAFRFIEQYHAASSTTLNQDCQEHLNGVLDAFFNIGKAGNTGADNAQAVKSGLQQLISLAITGFIGSTSAGESEERFFMVVPENNAFVRVDVYCWRYNFQQTKLIEQKDTVIAYVLCKSVVDHSALTLDELIYLVTEAMVSAGARPLTDVETKALNDARTAVETKRAALPRPVDNPSADQKAAYKKARDEYLTAVTEFARLSGKYDLAVRSAPSMEGIAAYIAELRKVWHELSTEASDGTRG